MIRDNLPSDKVHRTDLVYFPFSVCLRISRECELLEKNL